MDAQRFQKGLSRGFVRKQDLRTNGPQRFTVASVEEREGFSRNEGGPREMELHLVFADGPRFSLRTQENLNRMIAAFTYETEKWIGQVVELYFSPDIRNPTNPNNPGGIRLRVPGARERVEAYRSDLEDEPPAAPKGKGYGAEPPRGRRSAEATPEHGDDDLF